MGDSIARRRYIAAFAIPKTEAENECGSVCCLGRNIFGLLQQVPEPLSSGTGCPKLFSLLLYSFRCGRHTWSLGFLSFEKEPERWSYIMEIIETVLKNIYSASDQYRILNDPEYFIDLLVKQYRPEFKYDCKLLEKGIRCGAGNIVWQFVNKKTMPTDEDNAKFTSLLQERANLTLDEANRLIGLLYAMTGFSSPRKAHGKTIKEISDRARTPLSFSSGGFFNRLAQGLPRIAPIHSLLSIVYVVFMIVSINNGATVFVLGSFLFGTNIALMFFAAIFAVLGLFLKRGWPYLTAAIIQTVALLTILTPVFIQPLLGMIAVAIPTMGYIAFVKINRAKGSTAKSIQ